MIDQLRARGAIHRVSEIVYLGGVIGPADKLRAMLLDHGVWSPREALDSLEAVDYQARGGALWALAPILPDEYLGRAIDLATQRGWADDTRWKVYQKLVDMLVARAAHPTEHGRQFDERHAATIESQGDEQTGTPESAADALADFLFGERATGRDLWNEPWSKALVSYIARVRYVDRGDRWRQGFALVAELARDRASPQSGVLRNALLNSGHWLWREPWFHAVFDVEERREHLRQLVADDESTRVPWINRVRALLDIAKRLQGSRRAAVVRWAIACLETRGSRWDPFYHVHAAALAEKPELAAILTMLEAWLDEPSIVSRLRAIAAMMPWVSTAEAVDLARRVFAWIAAGEAPHSELDDVLAAIPPLVWATLGRAEWEAALNSGDRHALSSDLSLLAIASLPDEVRCLIEERGLPYLLERPAYERLQTGAKIIHALSAAGRARLMESVLALDVATWREAAVDPFARVLDDSDLERLCRILHEPDPKGEIYAERALAEAWAARGRIDRAASLVARITDDEKRVLARVAIAIAAEDANALPPELDAQDVNRVLEPVGDSFARWTPHEHSQAFADALASRLSEQSAAWARLRVWATLWAVLSTSMQAELAPQIERAVDIVLAEDEREDDALFAIAEFLPARLLERIWIARASASAYRHAIDLYETRFCEFMLAGYGRTHVLHFLQVLGGDDALFEHARWLSGTDDLPPPPPSHST